MHISFFFFFNDTATTEIYTLSLHDALPISKLLADSALLAAKLQEEAEELGRAHERADVVRSEEHTSELQSLAYLVCRLLLEKKKKKTRNYPNQTRKRVLSEQVCHDYSVTVC